MSPDILGVAIAVLSPGLECLHFVPNNMGKTDETVCEICELAQRHLGSSSRLAGPDELILRHQANLACRADDRNCGRIVVH